MQDLSKLVCLVTAVSCASRHEVRARVEAGSLTVPERRTSSTGKSLEIPYYRVRSTAARPAAPIFLLAGGPGASLLDRFETEELSGLVEYLRTIADVVLFDQRGAGRSTPSLTCDGTATFPLHRPLDLDGVARAMQQLAAACRARVTAAGSDLAGLTTEESAEDVDALRAALGYERITLIGGSYGSHLALAVMRRFPDRIDRAVLYGVEGPDHTWDDPAAKLATLERIAAAVEASPAMRDRIPDGGLVAALRAAIARLDAAPTALTVTRDGREVTVVVDGTIARLMAAREAGRRRRPLAWPEMILALHRGDDRPLADAAIELRTLRLRSDAPMHFSMECASGVSAERDARYRADPATAILGDLNLGLRAVCASWGGPDLGAAFRAPVVSEVPTLLLHGTWDLSTPIENAREVVATLANGQLVEVVEGGHDALDDLLDDWPPMRPQLAAFLRGDPVRFPSHVALPRGIP